MPIEEQLKEYILGKYKSIREFSIESNIPYSTVDNIFKRGVFGTGMSTIMKVCEHLNLSIDNLAKGIIEAKNESESLDDKLKITFEMYQMLDSDDQAEIRGEIKAMLRHEKYQVKKENLA